MLHAPSGRSVITAQGDAQTLGLRRPVAAVTVMRERQLAPPPPSMPPAPPPSKPLPPPTALARDMRPLISEPISKPPPPPPPAAPPPPAPDEQLPLGKLPPEPAVLSPPPPPATSPPAAPAPPAPLAIVSGEKMRGPPPR